MVAQAHARLAGGYRLRRPADSTESNPDAVGPGLLAPQDELRELEDAPNDRDPDVSTLTPIYSHISRLLATSSARDIARALLRDSSYSREGTESATTPPPAWK